jgi:hypothetical protein
MISFFAYQPFLLGRTLVPLAILAFGVLVILTLVAHKAIRALYP